MARPRRRRPRIERSPRGSAWAAEVVRIFEKALDDVDKGRRRGVPHAIQDAVLKLSNDKFIVDPQTGRESHMSDQTNVRLLGLLIRLDGILNPGALR